MVHSSRCTLARHACFSCLSGLLVAFVCGGATCANRHALQDFAPPVVFESEPTLDQLMANINRSLAIQQLESHTLSISSDEFSAKLRGNLQWQRPHNFNLQAYPGSPIMGTVFAAGSNSEMFWLQTQMPSPPKFYYARHDTFEQHGGPRRMLPVSPLWLREALGVVELDPTHNHEGPTVRADGKLEIRSYIPSPRGHYRRHLVLHARTGTIEQTLLYNHVGKLVAVAQQSDHKYYAAVDFSLPRQIDIQLQPDEGPVLAFQIKIGFHLINEPIDPSTFAHPDTTGLIREDLVQTNAGQPIAAVPTYTSAQRQPILRLGAARGPGGRQGIIRSGIVR